MNLPNRFTSAHAEKIHTSPTESKLSAVHLRTRGENVKKAVFSAKTNGSPPHTRRKLKASRHEDNPTRFTSAHAEKIVFGWDKRFRVAVHLRTRGENIRVGSVFLCRLGSPPHTRRKYLNLLANIEFLLVKCQFSFAFFLDGD
jgi:hypothetical protein